MIRRYPLSTYYVLVFAISWGGILALIRVYGIPSTPDEFNKALPLAIAAMLAGPSVAGILMTALVDGRMGLRELLASLLRWRVAVVWYALALLAAPVVGTAALSALSLVSPAFLPGLWTTDDKASRLLFGLAAAAVVGILEELGWTGFAIPKLRLRYSVLASGLIAGILWGAWHIMGQVVLASGTYTGDLSPPLFMAMRTILLLIGGLVAYRVLMVWVYDRTGSLLVAMLMHFSLTASAMVLEPAEIAGEALVVYDLVSAAMLWAVVAAVGRAKGRLSRSKSGDR